MIFLTNRYQILRTDVLVYYSTLEFGQGGIFACRYQHQHNTSYCQLYEVRLLLCVKLQTLYSYHKNIFVVKEDSRAKPWKNGMVQLQYLCPKIESGSFQAESFCQIFFNIASVLKGSKSVRPWGGILYYVMKKFPCVD